MAPIDIIVLILALGLAAYTLFGFFFRKKESPCGCNGCSGCASPPPEGGCPSSHEEAVNAE